MDNATSTQVKWWRAVVEPCAYKERHGGSTENLAAAYRERVGEADTQIALNPSIMDTVGESRRRVSIGHEIEGSRRIIIIRGVVCSSAGLRTES